MVAIPQCWLAYHATRTTCKGFIRNGYSHRSAAIVRETGLSARTIERLFRHETGMSVGAWAKQLRLVLALEKLAAGQSVGDAAFEVGYSNPSNFIVDFRTAFGVTPSRYFAGAG